MQNAVRVLTTKSRVASSIAWLSGCRRPAPSRRRRRAVRPASMGWRVTFTGPDGAGVDAVRGLRASTRAGAIHYAWADPETPGRRRARLLRQARHLQRSDAYSRPATSAGANSRGRRAAAQLAAESLAARAREPAELSCQLATVPIGMTRHAFGSDLTLLEQTGAGVGFAVRSGQGARISIH